MGGVGGVGWEVYAGGGRRLIGHDGNTIGQASFMRLVPDAGVAIVLLTNGGDGMGLFHDVAGPLLRELAGVDLPESPTPSAEPAALDAAPFAGVYSRSEEHTSELQSLMRISYAVFCLKQKNKH